MNIKKVILGTLKVLSAACVAGIVLTGFSYFYYNIPIQKEDESGSTDHVWESKVFYSRGTEGFAWGKTNDEGYVNRYDYSEYKNVDTLLIGSSHMEAYQVGIDESTASVLDDMLGKKKVYNIGISAHDFMVCLSNYSEALKKYKPKSYVVFETDEVSFDTYRLYQVSKNALPEIEVNEDSLVTTLQKNMYLRLLYKQFNIGGNASVVEANTANEDEGVNENIDENAKLNSDIGMTKTDKKLWKKILKKLSKDAKKYKIDAIIAYHPFISIDADGDMIIDKSKEKYVNDFKKLCKKYGIGFVDSGDKFLEEYKEHNLVPYGFLNTSVGVGHFNKYGHKMFADCIYEEMVRREK